MWLSTLAFLTVVGYLLKSPRIKGWTFWSRLLIGLFLFWAGLVLSPDVASQATIRFLGAIAIFFSAGLLLVDLFGVLIRRGRDYLAARYRPAAPLKGYLMELCRATQLLAAKKIGALIIIERKDILVEGVIKGGVPFDAEIKAEVLIALFSTSSPVHDGAIIISGERIRRVKTLLPLSTKSALPLGIGTRHRSAIGITEKTDAIALVVSEERGEISIAYRGGFAKTQSEKDLTSLLRAAFRGKAIAPVDTQKR